MTGESKRGSDGAGEELLREAIIAADGDLRAFEQIVQQHQKRIVADCRYMTRDSDTAEDLAQEIFVKVFFRFARLRGTFVISSLAAAHQSSSLFESYKETRR